MSLITMDGLSIRFAGNTLLHDVNLAVDHREIVAILGPNGSGKTTLLRTLIGAMSPSSGTIWRRPGIRLGYVPQRLYIDDTLPMTVNRFLCLPKRHSAGKVANALATAGLEAHGKQQLATLSGGQFQRALLARALLDEPDLLLLDEATRGLDFAGAKAFYQQIDRVRDAFNCGVLLISHELNSVMQVADRVICLKDTIRCEGSPEQVAGSEAYRTLFGIDQQAGPEHLAGVDGPGSRAPVYHLHPVANPDKGRQDAR